MAICDGKMADVPVMGSCSERCWRVLCGHPLLKLVRVLSNIKPCVNSLTSEILQELFPWVSILEIPRVPGLSGTQDDKRLSHLPAPEDGFQAGPMTKGSSQPGCLWPLGVPLAKEVGKAEKKLSPGNSVSLNSRQQTPSPGMHTLIRCYRHYMN